MIILIFDIARLFEYMLSVDVMMSTFVVPAGLPLLETNRVPSPGFTEISLTSATSGRSYVLEMRQQPKHSRICGHGGKGGQKTGKNRN